LLKGYLVSGRLLSIQRFPPIRSDSELRDARVFLAAATHFLTVWRRLPLGSETATHSAHLTTWWATCRRKHRCRRVRGDDADGSAVVSRFCCRIAVRAL